MAPSPRRRHNKWVFLSFFHLVTLCFIPPNKRVDPRALRPSLPPSIHAWIALRPPACLMGGCSNKTMHSNGRTPTQKEAEAFVRPPRPRPAIVIILINGAYGRRPVPPSCSSPLPGLIEGG